MLSREIFSNDDCERLLKRSKTPVTDQNLIVTKFCVNTHVAICQDILGDRMTSCLSLIYHRYDLETILGELDDAATSFIAYLNQDADLRLATGYCSSYINGVIGVYTTSEGVRAAEETLLLLRYPLRLTLENDDDSAKKFLANNSSCSKYLARLLYFITPGRYTRFEQRLYPEVQPRRTNQLSREIMLMAREVASELVVPSNYVSIIERGAKFSHGTVTDISGHPCPLVKAGKVLEDGAISWSAFTNGIDLEFGHDCTFVDHASEVLFVPKNFKSKRTIGRLNTSRAYWAQGVRSLLLYSMPKAWRESIDLSDASASKMLAYLGSVTGDICTFDLSNASDRIPWDLVQFLFPNWVDILHYVRDWEFIIDGDIVPAHMYSCAGNATTFVVETYVFYCLAEACRRVLLQNPFIKPRSWKSARKWIRIYGDDCIVPSEISDLFSRALILSNAQVNERKTFTYGVYREACGGEYLNGIDVSSVYFPRSFKGTLNQVCSLEHSLFKYPSARAYLIDCARSLKPTLTSHIVGTPCTDLWDLVADPIRLPANKVFTFEGDGPNDPVDMYYTYVPQRHKVSVNAQDFLYRSFLLHGPLYESDRDAELGISTSRLDAYSYNVDDTTGEFVGRWVLVAD